jgi:hypothetical protein
MSDYTGSHADKVHNIDLGLKVRALHRCSSSVKIYGMPDAKELAR